MLCKLKLKWVVLIWAFSFTPCCKCIKRSNGLDHANYNTIKYTVPWNMAFGYLIKHFTCHKYLQDKYVNISSKFFFFFPHLDFGLRGQNPSQASHLCKTPLEIHTRLHTNVCIALLHAIIFVFSVTHSFHCDCYCVVEFWTLH